MRANSGLKQSKPQTPKWEVAHLQAFSLLFNSKPENQNIVSFDVENAVIYNYEEQMCGVLRGGGLSWGVELHVGWSLY